MRRILLIAICLCGVATLSRTLFADDQIATELISAKSEHRSAIESAHEQLVAKFADEKTKLSTSARLAIGEKVKLLDQLEAEQKAFEKDGAMPTSALLLSAVKQYQKESIIAREKLIAAFDKAARDYDKSGDLSAAKKVLEEKAKLTAEKKERRYVAIVSPATGKVLGVDGGSSKRGAHVIQWDAQKLAANQSWELVPTDGEWFQIKNRKSGLVMAIDGGSENDGVNVIQWPPNANAPELDHQWKLMPADEKNKKSKAVLLINRKSGKLLSLNAESHNNGVRLVQSKEFKGAKHQFWTLVPVE